MEHEVMTSELQTQNLALNKRVAELENTVLELSALVMEGSVSLTVGAFADAGPLLVTVMV